MHRRALEIWERLLGTDAPYVATILNEIEKNHLKQDQYAQAEPFAKRALAIHEKAYGPNEKALLESLNTLVCIYNSLGKFTESSQSISTLKFQRWPVPPSPTTTNGAQNKGWAYSG